ncbi:uncharacterized protein FRV6_04153 [Fusarium oxysporum]|uniref:Uncharacterized protein n=1 Tax=Fusarium oxysporum TaxID=5507 RepID=A0A2H3TAG7_FUSOX|nr:uncharacterized protein FRV6_04153 [Fusarium oxysporum]
MGKWVDGDGWALTPRFLVPAPPSKPKPASPRQCTSRPTHGAQVTAEGVEQQSKQRVALSLTSEHLSRRIESWWKTVDPSKGGVRFKVDHVSDLYVSPEVVTTTFTVVVGQPALPGVLHGTGYESLVRVPRLMPHSILPGSK